MTLEISIKNKFSINFLLKMIEARFNFLPLAQYMFIYASKIKNINNIKSPNLNFLFVEKVKDNDMIMPIIDDNGSVILFSKNISQKSKEKEVKRAYYSIARDFISYMILENGEILSDSLIELWKISPEYVMEYCTFIHNEEIITDLNNVNIKEITCYRNKTSEIMDMSISTFISYEETEAYLYLGYYIKNINYDYIHCFSRDSFDYNISLNFYEIIQYYGDNIIPEENYDDILNYIISSDIFYMFKNQLDKCNNEQELKIKISQFMCEQLIPFFFKI